MLAGTKLPSSALAREALIRSRSRLLVDLRFLDAATSRLEAKERRELTLPRRAFSGLRPAARSEMLPF